MLGTPSIGVCFCIAVFLNTCECYNSKANQYPDFITTSSYDYGLLLDAVMYKRVKVGYY